jgi:aldose 1-epimerase
MAIEKNSLKVFALRNKNGLEASFSNFGARWLSFVVPDRYGQFEDIVLGFDRIERYLTAEELYHGAVVGRLAGRIRNGLFRLGTKDYQLSINERFPDGVCTHLHGGAKGLSFQIWQGEQISNGKGEEAVRFKYLSPEGQEGYPGNLQVTVTYTLTQDNAVSIEYSAFSDTATPVSLSNHAYFNLDGGKESTILKHELQVSSKNFLEFDLRNFCVTGRSVSVEGTPMDFFGSKEIGADINRKDEHLIPGRGYNVFYILDKNGGADAILKSAVSGRRLDLFTTEAGLQLYCAGYWSGIDFGKHGCRYDKYGGVAMEAQGYPDAINHPKFPSVLLEPNQEYKQVTTWQLSNF